MRSLRDSLAETARKGTAVGPGMIDILVPAAELPSRRSLQAASVAIDLSEDEAISLMSVAVDFGVTQVVDANWVSAPS
jgi:acetamidase/formamidase